MATKQLNTALKASVTVTQSGSKNGRKTFVSFIRIIAGDSLVVATAKKGGKYSESQAMADFRLNPDQFNKGQWWELRLIPQHSAA